MNFIDIYLLTRLDAIKDVITLFFWGSIIIWCCIWGIYTMVSDGTQSDYVDAVDKHKKFYLMFPIILAGILAIVNAFLPSSKDMAIIVGIDKFINSPEINNLTSLLYEKIQSLLMVK